MATRLPRAVGCVSTVWLVACSSALSGQQQCVPGVVVSGAEKPEGGGIRIPDLKDPTGAADYFVDFGAAIVGDRARAGLSLENTGSGELRVEVDGVSGPFERASPEELVLEAGESGEIEWSFRPTSEGRFEIVARVVWDDHEVAVRLVGEGFEPVTDCTPRLLDFGPGVVGETREATVSCVHRGRHPFALVVGPVAGADAATFDVDPVSPLPLGPGDRWEIRVTATPRRAERLLAVLPLSTPTGRSAGAIALGVNGLSHAVTCVPATLDFGFVAPGGEAHVALDCQNASATPVRLTRLALDPSSHDGFSWTAATPIAIPAAVGGVPGAATVDVAFRPLADEAGLRKRGILVIESDDARTPRLDLPMTGFVGGPRLTCWPERLEFGTVAQGLPLTRTITCTNNGWDDLTRLDDNLVIGRIESSSPEVTAAIHGELQPGGYAVGQALAIDVTYAPTGNGLDVAKLLVHSNDATVPADRPRAITVSGTGRVMPPCDFELEPANLRFGRVERGTGATLEFAVRNRRNDAECFVRNVRLGPNCDAEFSLPAGPVSLASLLPGQRFRVPVRFTPHAYRGAPYTCDVLFDITKPDAPHQVVRLSGLSQLSCGFAVRELDFGKITPGCASQDRWIHVYNTCPEPLAIASIDVGEGPSDEFHVRWHPSLPVEVAPGKDVSFTVAYRPQDEGGDLGAVLVRLEGEPEPLLVMVRGSSETDAVQSDRFQQENGATDVLWVVDNAATMGAEQAALAEAVPSFLEGASGFGADFHLGVTTTGLAVEGGCAGGGEDGRLVPVGHARPRILAPTTPNLEANLSANLEVGACGAERLGMEAALRAVFPPLETTCDDPRHPEPGDGNCGFLRDDARLAIVAVSDGADESPGSVEFYYQALVALKGLENRHLVQVHAVTGDAGTGCTAGPDVAAPGDAWVALAERSLGGSVHSICTEDWDSTLDEVARAVFRPPGCFGLTGAPEDTNGNWVIDEAEGEIAVNVDGLPVTSAEAEWTYRPDLGAVCFAPEAVPTAGAQIQVRYRPACVEW